MAVDRIPPSLAISVGVHVLLAGAWWLVEVSPEPPPIDDVAPAKIELVERTETAVEVVMLDAQELARVPGLAAEPPIAKVAPTRSASRIAANRRMTREPEVVRATEPVITHTPSPFSDFRKGRDLEGRGRDALKLTTPALEKMAVGEPETRSVIETSNAGAIVDPKVKESIVTAEITPGGHGGYKVDDLVFEGRIERDGSVSMQDKANVQHQFKSWKHVKQVLRAAGPLGLLKLDFDITDAMMRRKKIDPYASRKLAFLDETRDARVELGKEYRKEVLARTAQIVRQNLEATWQLIGDPAQRKQALFELWDEVDETGDEELVEAGKSARAAIIGFIRARLPSGGASAISSADLARLNAKRRSRATFAPY